MYIYICIYAKSLLTYMSCISGPSIVLFLVVHHLTLALGSEAGTVGSPHGPASKCAGELSDTNGSIRKLELWP